MSDIQKSDPNTAAIAGTNGAMRNGNGAGAEATPGAIRATDIINEMQVAYLDYAMSVIVARALPDVRDGLKPVHRRILYAMWHDLGLTHDKPHKKSARIVGEVLGKYHPHGDTAVYDAMVRMAQPFSLRYPLIDGQGNFGSVDGDNAAAMRYTEARLAAISDLMLEDLEKDTVDWHPNFDNTLREPDIVPAALPNLLINGSSGIAVGMATNIPPHNLGEVVDAAAWMIDHFDKLDDIHTNDLMQFIKGPDFPTGGIIYRLREESKNGSEPEKVDVIHQGYSTGRARLIMQAKAHFEEMQRGRSRIVVTELPYQTNKTTLIERIADLVRDGKIEGISDLRDESDRSGMRVCIELGRGIEPKSVLADLFKYTPLQQTFGMQLLALVDGQPRTLNLKRMLQHFIQHRQEIIRRRSEFDLARAKERLHIVEGLLKALDILDEVIATIRRSQTVDTARKNLIANFKFTEIQAQAILELQLRRLAALERKKLQEEHDELKKRIAWLEDLLRSPHKVLELIKSDLLAIKEKYGDARRTQIVDLTKGAHTTHDLLPEQEVWVTVGTDGELRSANAGKFSQSVLRGAAKGSEAALLHANARDLLFLFTGTGRAAKLGVHEIPTNGSKNMTELTALAKRERVMAALSIPRPNGEELSGYAFLATEQGVVKRVALADLVASVSDGNIVINVEEKDRLGWVLRSDGAREILLVTNSGQAIRFGEEDVRSMGLAAAGVGGIKLGKGERVIYAGVVEPEGFLLTATATGFAKLTPLAEFPKQGRNGGGVVAHKLQAARTGDVTAAALLPAANLPRLLALLAAKSTPRIVETSDIPRQARAALGKLVVEGAAGAPPTAVRWLEGGDVVEAPTAAEKRAPRLIEEAPAPSPTPAAKAALPVKQVAAPAKAVALPAQKATLSEKRAALPDAKPVPPAQAARAAVVASATPAKTGARFVPAKAPAADIEKEAPDAAKSKRVASPEKVDSPAKAVAPAKAASASRTKPPAQEELPPADGLQATLFADPDLALPKSKASKLKTVTSVKKK